MANSPRRVVRIKKRKNIPTLSELRDEAHARGVTLKEHVEYLSQLNRRLKKK